VAVHIRLTRLGSNKRPHYRIVAADKQYKRDGRFLEILGTYNPKRDPIAVTMKEDRLKYWVEQGALVSDTVASLVKKALPNFLEARAANKLAKVQKARKARKARLAKKGGEKKTSEKPAAKKRAAKKTAEKTA
jgi:small subunit ribosomal protein S16